LARIILASQLCEKISSSLLKIRNDHGKNSPEQFTTVLMSIQLSIERFVKQFEIILGLLPDPDSMKGSSSSSPLEKPESLIKLKSDVATYVRTDTIKIAASQLSTPEIQPKLPPSTTPASNKPICVPACILVLNVANKILVRTDILLSKLKDGYQKSTYEKLKIVSSQYEILAGIALQTAMTADSDLLFFKPQSDPEWLKLKPFYIVDVFF